MATDKKILIAVDESENSKMALLYVADFLGGFNGFSAIILSVIAVPEEGFFESDAERKSWIESKRQSISKMLGRYQQILIQSGFPEGKVLTELVLAKDRPVSEIILEKQEQYDACTLVVGRRGVSKHEEFLFGSVSSKLIHLANRCAVWVVEPVCRARY
jgi:nucleotide-binding universal stress UspA family protein